MTLPASGPIHSGHLRSEIYKSGAIELNDPKLRKLIGKFPTGPVPMGDFRGITYNSESSYVYYINNGSTTPLTFQQMDLDSLDNIYISSGMQLHKYSSDGTWVWSKNITAPVTVPTGTPQRTILAMPSNVIKLVGHNSLTATEGAAFASIVEIGTDASAFTTNRRDEGYNSTPQYGYRVHCSTSDGHYLVEMMQYDPLATGATAGEPSVVGKIDGITNQVLWVTIVTHMSDYTKVWKAGIASYDDKYSAVSPATGFANSYSTTSFGLAIGNIVSGTVARYYFYATSYVAATNFSVIHSSDRPILQDATGVYILLRNSVGDFAVGITKFNLSGESLWTTMFQRDSNSASNNSCAFTLSPDGTKLILGFTQGPTSGRYQVFVWIDAVTGAYTAAKKYTKVPNYTSAITFKSARASISGFGAIFAATGIILYRVPFDGQFENSASAEMTMEDVVVTPVSVSFGVETYTGTGTGAITVSAAQQGLYASASTTGGAVTNATRYTTEKRINI